MHRDSKTQPMKVGGILSSERKEKKTPNHSSSRGSCHVRERDNEKHLSLRRPQRLHVPTQSTKQSIIGTISWKSPLDKNTSLNWTMPKWNGTVSARVDSDKTSSTKAVTPKYQTQKFLRYVRVIFNIQLVYKVVSCGFLCTTTQPWACSFTRKTCTHTQIVSLKEIFMLLWEQWQDQPHRAWQKGKFLKAVVSLQNSNYNFKQRIY